MRIAPNSNTKIPRLARHTLAIGLVFAPLLLSSSGCRQRAFTELYVEHMASEIRSLEDIVYEFDAEYRALEYEVEDLKRTNAELQAKLQLAQSARSTLPYDRSPSDNLRPGPSGSGSLNLAPEKPRNGDGQSSGSNRSNDNSRSDVDTKDNSSLLKSPPPMRLPRTQVEDIGNLDMPEVVIPKQPNPAATPAGNTPTDANPSSISNPGAPSSLLKSESAPPSSLLPETLPSSIQPPAALPPSTIPPTGKVVTPTKDAELLPPTLEKSNTPDSSGKPVRAKEPLQRPAPAGLPQEVSGAVLKERKIEIPSMPPVQKASANIPLASPKSAQDSRVREIDFHPTLCRGLNVDGKPGDEGLYLVLVPRNASQQFVPTAGTLTIVAEETGRDGESVRVGRWEMSSEQLQDLLEPIGAAQGFHVKLHWQGKVPATSAIDVYVRLACDDRTTMVNRKQIHLRTSNTAPSAWTPR
ncbi:MAG: hypothetical protein FJ308_10795 [Planctomycetes bacterium]|nr:hypothetical protein [Planctomycetota bacterium]